MELTIQQVLQQGVAAHDQGNLQEAERLYRAILQSQPEHPDANHNLGVLAVSLNKALAALPLFKIALEANPKIEQFWLSYVDALIKANQLQEAKQTIKKAKNKGFDAKTLETLLSQPEVIIDTKEPSQAQLNTVLEHYQNGRFSEAEKLATFITREFPKHQLAWKVLGAIFRQTDRKAEAINANQTSVALSPQDALAHNNLGVTLQELGRLDEAEASYNQAIALKPDLADAHYNLGVTLQELGRLDEARAIYTQAIALKADYAEAHNNLGITLKELGRLDESESSYTQAIALEPDFAEAHSNLGITLRELGRLDEAEASCRQAIALKPDYAEAHSNLGSALKELGRLDEAETSWKQAIALKPDYAEAHCNLGHAFQTRSRLDEAEASYGQAIALKPDYAEAHSDLGVMLKEMGRLDEAEASYRQAIALKPDYAEAHSNLGITLKALGRLDEAEASYTQAIVLKPDYALAHSNLGVVLYINGDINSGLESLEKANNLNPNFYENQIILTILQARKARGETEFSVANISNLGHSSGQFRKPVILNRAIETDLISSLYKMKSVELDKFENSRISDPRFGDGKCSRDFELFKDDSPIIKSVAEDLIIILSEVVRSDVYISESWFNILGAGGGTTPHKHIGRLDTDEYLNFGKQKYSVVYYLSVGDQNCRDPGILKLYDPSEDILPCEGMIAIFRADRKHSAVYGGKTDRVMIGINFYSL